MVLSEELSYEEIFQPSWTDIRSVWQGLAGRQVLTIPHFHNLGRLDDDDQPAFLYVRAAQVDGETAWSSPIRFE